MKYLINEPRDWADEFDVNFLEVVSEEDKKIYTAAKKVYGRWIDSYGFGTNEGWEDDFDYLDFDLIELTDEEAKVFDKFYIRGYTIMDSFIELLIQEIDDLEMCGRFKKRDIKKQLREMSESELEEFFTELKEAAE